MNHSSDCSQVHVVQLCPDSREDNTGSKFYGNFFEVSVGFTVRLEALLESSEKNRTDFLVQLQIGKLYLYGQNPTDNVIDLPNAEKHLRLAARYANSEIQHLPDAAKFCGEAFLHAAISCYVQANEKWLAGDADAAKHFTEQALELSQNATKVYPQLTEAFYNHAKFSALLGDGETTVNSLKTVILTDRSYCIKADADRDFDGVREYVQNLFESLRQQAKQEAKKAFEPVKKLLEDWVYQGPDAIEAEAEIRKLFEQAEQLYRKDTYFDYLEALPLLKKAQETFDQIPLFIESSSIGFSPDGRYLVIGSSYDTYTIYQTDGFKQIATSEQSPGFSPDGRYLVIESSYDTYTIYQTDGSGRVRGVISRQEFEEQEKRWIEAEREAKRRRKEEEERRKREVERRRKEQELREYRLKNKLCLECGEKLSFWDKLSGAQYCKRHRR